MPRFSWIRPGALAGCSRPGALDDTTLAGDLPELPVSVSAPTGRAVTEHDR